MPPTLEARETEHVAEAGIAMVTMAGHRVVSIALQVGLLVAEQVVRTLQMVGRPAGALRARLQLATLLLAADEAELAELGLTSTVMCAC